MKSLILAATLLLVGGRQGAVVFPGGADLGSESTVTVAGSPGIPASATITFDSIRSRTYRGESLSYTFQPWLFDWQRGSNYSVVEFSITGSTFEMSFITAFGVTVMDVTGGFDGTLDFDGSSGSTLTVNKQVRATLPVKAEHLPLFVGDTVTMDVRYFGFTSIAASGQAVAEVDEHMLPARVTVRFTQP